MKPGIALAAFLLFAGGCGADRDSTEKPNASSAEVEAVDQPSRETYALGTAVSATGAVPQNATGEQFVRGGEVYLSVDVSSASTDQTIEVKWVDPHGRVLRHDQRVARQGADHYVPFSSGATAQWPPGPHRAVVVIDGRTVTEKQFAVL